ncbi:MAG: hypothetical protein ACRDJ5_08385 [Actinomycetota bacterium]
MERLYVIGGRQRERRRLLSQPKGWYKYKSGLVFEVVPARQDVRLALEYVSPPQVRADDEPAILFKSASIEGDELYLCTETELLILRLPRFERIGYVSLPSFNDVHHVRAGPEGNLLVANAGLDMILETTREGTILREWDALGGEPWGRFSRDVDYRKVGSTKPHASHPNHVFLLGDEIWVTRFEQKDAVCLTRPGPRIDIGIERAHDGLVHGDRIYFTTVDGHVVVVDEKTLEVEHVVDLNQAHDDGQLAGWCRGLSVTPEGDVWVGFSRLRPTQARDNVAWVKQGFRRMAPTHITRYRLSPLEVVRDVPLEGHGMNAVFSILPAYR